MTAEQKEAKKFIKIFGKKLSIKCVDEILKIAVDFSDDIYLTKGFWQSVRNEIINYK